MARASNHKHLGSDRLLPCGLSPELVLKSVEYTHRILDEIDDKLVQVDAGRLAQMVELANLSAIVGNLFGAGLAKNSNNIFVRNGPHKYPDLLSQDKRFKDVEIKVSLEKNPPKSHLAKEGLHLICRYVLVQENGKYRIGERGPRAAIWEVRFGDLRREHYNISNTDGDSGKTAVVSADGMAALNPVYVDLDLCPYKPNSGTFKKYLALLSNS